MIEQIEIIGYAVILFIFLIISAILIIDNYKLQKECKNTIANMEELEQEMRFKFDLQPRRNFKVIKKIHKKDVK